MEATSKPCDQCYFSTCFPLTTLQKTTSHPSTLAIDDATLTTVCLNSPDPNPAKLTMSGSLSARFLESLTAGQIIAAGFVLLVSSFIADFTWKPQYPKSLPRVGHGDGIVATVRNWLGYTVHYNSWVEDGYKKVWAGDSCLLVAPSPLSALGCSLLSPDPVVLQK